MYLGVTDHNKHDPYGAIIILAASPEGILSAHTPPLSLFCDGRGLAAGCGVNLSEIRLLKVNVACVLLGNLFVRLLCKPVEWVL